MWNFWTMKRRHIINPLFSLVEIYEKIHKVPSLAPYPSSKISDSGYLGVHRDTIMEPHSICVLLRYILYNLKEMHTLWPKVFPLFGWKCVRIIRGGLGLANDWFFGLHRFGKVTYKYPKYIRSRANMLTIRNTTIYFTARQIMDIRSTRIQP